MDNITKIECFLNDMIDEEGYPYAAGFMASMINNLLEQCTEEQQKKICKCYGID